MPEAAHTNSTVERQPAISQTLAVPARRVPNPSSCADVPPGRTRAARGEHGMLSDVGRQASVGTELPGRSPPWRLRSQPSRLRGGRRSAGSRRPSPPLRTTGRLTTSSLDDASTAKGLSPRPTGAPEHPGAGPQAVSGPPTSVRLCPWPHPELAIGSEGFRSSAQVHAGLGSRPGFREGQAGSPDWSLPETRARGRGAVRSRAGRRAWVTKVLEAGVARVE